MSIISDKFNLTKQEKESITPKTVIQLILLIVVLLIFIIVPFLHNVLNRFLAQILWYPSLIAFFFTFIYSKTKDRNPVFNDPTTELFRNWGEFTLIPIFLSVFVFNYYSIDYIWHWLVFAFAAIYFPLFIFNVLIVFIKDKNPNKEESEIILINFLKYVFLCWFIDAFYISIVNDSLVFIFFFGILATVSIFFNVTSAFLNGEKSLLFLVVLEFLVGVGLSVYLIYIIPNVRLQEIVLNIIAAILGGFLTLVGVAWTFKKSDKDRNENDRKQAKPFIGVIGDMSDKATVANKNPIQFCKKNYEDTLKMKLHCFLQNSDKCIFYFDKVQVDDTDYYPDSSLFISKNEMFAIYIMETSQWEPKDKTIRIFVTDINYEQRIFEILPGTESHYSRIVEIT